MNNFGEALYETSNLLPDETGLDNIVWVSTKLGSSQHGPRIKVKVDGKLIPITIDDNPIVAIETSTRIPNLGDIKKWIIVNKEILTNYWNSDGSQMFEKEKLKRI